MFLPTRSDLVAQLNCSIQEITTSSGWCGYYDGLGVLRLKFDQRTLDATNRLWALLRQLLDNAYPNPESGGPS